MKWGCISFLSKPTAVNPNVYAESIRIHLLFIYDAMNSPQIPDEIIPY